MISYRFVPISSQKGVLFFETPGIPRLFLCKFTYEAIHALLKAMHVFLHLTPHHIKVKDASLKNRHRCEYSLCI